MVLQSINKRLSSALGFGSSQLQPPTAMHISSPKTSVCSKPLYFGHVDKQFMRFISIVYKVMKRDDKINIKIPKGVHIETLLSSLNTHFNRHPLRKDYIITILDDRLVVHRAAFVTWSRPLDIEEVLSVGEESCKGTESFKGSESIRWTCSQLFDSIQKDVESDSL